MFTPIPTERFLNAMVVSQCGSESNVKSAIVPSRIMISLKMLSVQ